MSSNCEQKKNSSSPDTSFSASNEGRIFVNEDLRKNPSRFIINPDQLPEPTFVTQGLETSTVHTVFSILEKERNSLHIPVSRRSLNVAQFVAVVSALIEGIELRQSGIEPLLHFKNFSDSYKQAKELSLITFDMDDLTSLNKQYTHLHGSIVCSTLERTILEVTEDLGGLLASMGEENLAALPFALEDARVVTDTILQRFTSISFDFGAGEFHQGVSAGISSLNHSDPRTFRRLIELSGGGLVYSKKHGKGIITVFCDK